MTLARSSRLDADSAAGASGEDEAAGQLTLRMTKTCPAMSFAVDDGRYRKHAAGTVDKLSSRSSYTRVER